MFNTPENTPADKPSAAIRAARIVATSVTFSTSSTAPTGTMTVGAESVRHPDVPTELIVDEKVEFRRAADRILSTTSAPRSGRVFRHTIVSVGLSEDVCDGNEETEGLPYEGDL